MTTDLATVQENNYGTAMAMSGIEMPDDYYRGQHDTTSGQRTRMRAHSRARSNVRVSYPAGGQQFDLEKVTATLFQTTEDVSSGGGKYGKGSPARK